MTARRVPVALLLLLLALAAGCGDPAPFPPEHWIERLYSEDAARRQEAIDALGRLGREDPEKVGALLVGMLERGAEQAVLHVRVVPDFTGVAADARDALLPRLDAAVRARVRLAGGTIARTVVEPDAIDVYVVRPAAKDVGTAQALVLAEIARRATVDLRVELPPPAPTSAEHPVSPFAGDAAEYQAWLDGERRLLAAGAAAYRPAVAGRRLVPRAAGAGDEGPVPVLEPQGPAQTFTEADLELLAQDDQGVPAVHVEPAAARAEDLRAFLKAHAGLRAWLVVDGEATLSAPIPVQSAKGLVFRVRASTLDEGRRRAAVVAATAALGRFPVPVTAKVQPRVPSIAADNPLAKAIAAIGPGVEPRLDALVQKDPVWGPLVDTLKDAILKGRSGQR